MEKYLLMSFSSFLNCVAQITDHIKEVSEFPFSIKAHGFHFLFYK